MRIKHVMASVKDDLMRERDEWDKANAAQRAKYESQVHKFHDASNEVIEAVREELIRYMPSNSVELSIQPSIGYSGRLSVEIMPQSNDVSLRWSWTVTLSKEGKVLKESNSWSGLSAVTQEDIEFLKDSVEIFQYLASIDWETFLNRDVPEWSDYITERSTIGARPDFNMQIKKAALDELVGREVAVRGKSSGRSYTQSAKVAYKILKHSGSQYTVQEELAYDVDVTENKAEFFKNNEGYAFRINADRLVSLIPDVDDIIELN